MISRWPLKARTGQKGQGLGGFEPGRGEEARRRPLAEKSRREPCVTCRKVLNLGRKRRITLGYFRAGTVSSANHPAASSTILVRPFFCSPTLSEPGFGQKSSSQTPNSCIQIPTASFLHLIHCPELTKIRALPIRSEKRSALHRAIIFSHFSLSGGGWDSGGPLLGLSLHIVARGSRPRGS